MSEDKENFNKFLEGDNDGFEVLAIKYRDKIVNYVNQFVNNIDIAEEISQDVFVYVLLHKKKYNMNYEFSTWIYPIARSKALNYIKRESRKVEIEDFDIYKSDIDLEEMVMLKEETKILKEKLGLLKGDYREVIYLANIEKLSYSEIGKIMNKSEKQVKTLLHNAREKLKSIRNEEQIK